MNELKLVVPPDFQGKELIVGGPEDFDNVRQQLRQEQKRHRTFGDMDSLANYVKTWGDQEKTTIFANLDGVTVVLDETDPLKTAGLSLVHSFPFKEWNAALTGQSMDQKQFKEFLEKRFGDVYDGVSLLSKVSNIQLTTTIQHDGSFDDENNYSVVFKQATDGKEDTMKLPKQFKVTVPLFEGDDTLYDLLVDLKLRVPKSSEERFRFEIRCHDLGQILRNGMKDQIAKLKGLMDGWQVYAGKAS